MRLLYKPFPLLDLVRLKGAVRPNLDCHRLATYSRNGLRIEKSAPLAAG